MKTDKQKMIIEGAKHTFLEKGLFNTVMTDIASACNITRRTLYRHFETKEDLAYETAILLINEWNDFQSETFLKLEGKGIELLESFLSQLIEYMTSRILELKYLGEFDFYFRDDGEGKPSQDEKDAFNGIILKSDDFIKNIIATGIEDGSIKPLVDIELMVATISNVLWSFAQRIALRGHIMEAEYGISGVTLIMNQVHLYIMALKE
ncbi:TetR/AcrR family transcriptional regulator [Fusibacter ferrireducens]|uniref:TetR/AcrR family transcriptional regulator n=1 Tax=Fusibacter ferrireducens TaxID=2785058 RepID=A0ABR9ZMF2_9FIRM|nr:TetR/AcrR family transcriptional regulator [Fusibacter ferrireducens]MBF4691616.1 TetR/AcrR family transcriptional regulator [Fusibacter ferrireducens]